MAVRVITPPEPLLTPADIPGSHAGDDPRIAALIAAAQEEIDGPDGWLGRSLGEQELEFSPVSFEGVRLPCPPIVDIVSITYLDREGERQTLSTDVYEEIDGCLLLKLGQKWPSYLCREGSILIRYQAGYDGTAVAEGGTGDVPARVKEAIILAVTYASSVAAENLFLRSEEVEGVGTIQYTVSATAGDLIRRMIEARLSTLRVYL